MCWLPDEILFQLLAQVSLGKDCAKIFSDFAFSEQKVREQILGGVGKKNMEQYEKQKHEAEMDDGDSFYWSQS